MKTLSTFYQSKDWRELLQIIKAERLTASGELICQHCGKQIVYAYDCIGHHKVPLTEENVNDVTISLNPENIMLVHHRCHNLIHNKLQQQQQKVFVVYGPPLAGKSTYVKKSMNNGDMVLDIDSVWECVSGLPRYIKPARLNAVVFGVRDCILEAVRYRRGKWLNAYIIGGYPLSSERERLLSLLQAEEIFIDTSKDICMQRLNMTEDGRDKKEWERYIEQWFERYTPPLLQEHNP